MSNFKLPMIEGFWIAAEKDPTLNPSGNWFGKMSIDFMIFQKKGWLYTRNITNVYVVLSGNLPPASSAGPPAKRRRVENDVDLDGEQCRVVCSIGSSAIGWWE